MKLVVAKYMIENGGHFDFVDHKEYGPCLQLRCDPYFIVKTNEDYSDNQITSLIVGQLDFRLIPKIIGYDKLAEIENLVVDQANKDRGLLSPTTFKSSLSFNNDVNAKYKKMKTDLIWESIRASADSEYKRVFIELRNIA